MNIIREYTNIYGCTLFKNFSLYEIKDALHALNARIVRYSKGTTIREQGAPVRHASLVARGAINIVKNDSNGNRAILARLCAGSIFGESLALYDKPSPVEAVAASASTLFMIDAMRLLSPPESLQPRLGENLVEALCQKIELLELKHDILSQRTIRDRLLLYLDYEVKIAQSKDLHIGFSREELADYLAINASALSREMGKMRDEGLLAFKKSHIELI